MFDFDPFEVINNVKENIKNKTAWYDNSKKEGSWSEQFRENMEKFAENLGAKTNTSNRKISLKCNGCGANVELYENDKSVVCPYCNNTVKNSESKSQTSKKNTSEELVKYPVVVFKEEGKYFACEHDFDIETDSYFSLDEALNDIKGQIEECLMEDEENFKIPTEQSLRQDEEVINDLNDGAKIKFVMVKKPYNDKEDW